jgi:hypothetical protein
LPDQAHCFGYVEGVFDEISAVQSAGFMPPVICEPGGINAGRLRDVVMKALRAQPELRANLGADLVFFAMLGAWPCKATR